jgi:hypothetical protein
LIKCRLKEAGHQNLRRQNASILLRGIANGKNDLVLSLLFIFLLWMKACWW